MIKNAEKKGEEENYTMVCDEGESSRQMTTSFPPTLDFVLVGLRFCPTDEELVKHYLKNKILGNDSIANNVIAEVDVCKYEPWDLLGKNQTNPINIFLKKCNIFNVFHLFQLVR